MKKMIVGLLVAAVAVTSWAKDDNFGLFDKKFGTISGHVQSLSMYRDYDEHNSGIDFNHSTTLGLLLGYDSPEIVGLKTAFAYNGVGVLDAWNIENTANPGDRLVQNGRVHVLNEGYLQYRFSALNASNTTVLIGRRILNNEIFTASPIRQKSRSIEGISIASSDIPHLKLQAGHTWKLSNVWDSDLAANMSWRFRDYGQVFGAGKETHGISWGEVVFDGVKNLEIALFNAYAFDVANMTGARVKYNVTDNTAIGTLFRHELPVGNSTMSNADCVSLYVEQKIGGITFEGGYFGVFGEDLRFNEISTGINHALNDSLMIYSGMYDEGANTVYLKASTKIKATTLYALGHVTYNDVKNYDGQELDLVVKQQLTEKLSVALKGGIGAQQYDNDTSRLGTDGRVFLTYNF